VTVSQNGGEAAAGFEAYLWSESRPVGGAAYDVRPGAAAEHRADRGYGREQSEPVRTEHPCDARFGRDVGHVVAEAQRQIDQRRLG